MEQERLKSVSAQLQHKIAEYLAKKKVCVCTLPARFNDCDFRRRSALTLGGMSLTRKRDTNSAWVSALTVIIMAFDSFLVSCPGDV